MANENEDIGKDAADVPKEAGIEVPQEYQDMYDSKTLSAGLLDAVCYTYNKIAKNDRDSGDSWNMEECYGKKDDILSAVEPICIHCETYEYNYNAITSLDREYEYCKPDFDVVRTFQNSETGETVLVGFWESRDPIDFPRYYLFYDMGGDHTYHHPIDFDPDDEYLKNFIVKDIDVLHTYGADVNTLLPVSFCDKVCELVKSGDFTFVPADNLFERILQNEDVIGERNIDARLLEWEAAGLDTKDQDKFVYHSRVEQLHNLPDDIRSVIQDPSLSYTQASLMLEYSAHLTAEDIHEAAEITFDPDVDNGSFASKLEEFLDDRSKLNYADAVSQENHFDDKQTEIVEQFGSFSTEFADLTAVMLNCGYSADHISDVIFSKDDAGLRFSGEQALVIADAYSNGLSEDKIETLIDTCMQLENVGGDALHNIEDCLIDGGDPEKIEACLSAMSELSDFRTIDYNIDHLLIPAAEGEIDVDTLTYLADVLTENQDYLDDHPAGLIIDKCLDKGLSLDDMKSVVDDINDKIGMWDTSFLYLDAYASCADPDLIKTCLDAGLEYNEIDDVVNALNDGIDSGFLNSVISDPDNGIADRESSILSTFLPIACDMGLNNDELKSFIHLASNYDESISFRYFDSRVPIDIASALKDGVSEDTIVALMDRIFDPDNYDYNEPYLLNCCIAEVINGVDLENVMHDIDVFKDRDNNVDNFDKILGYSNTSRVPDRDSFNERGRGIVCKDDNFYVRSVLCDPKWTIISNDDVEDKMEENHEDNKISIIGLLDVNISTLESCSLLISDAISSYKQDIEDSAKEEDKDAVSSDQNDIAAEPEAVAVPDDSDNDGRISQNDYDSNSDATNEDDTDQDDQDDNYDDFESSFKDSID